jgi:plastocyanin
MHRRIPVALAATAALGASALAIAPAIAAPAKSAPKKARIVIRGGHGYVPGVRAFDNVHFATRTITVRSGGQVTVFNKGEKGAPHTLSFVKRRQLPRTTKAIDACGNFQSKVCVDLLKAHQADPNTGEVKQPIVDVNKPGVDGPGDSYYIDPKTPTLSFKITAKKGKTLYYFCAVHPWMQGSIKVR